MNWGNKLLITFLVFGAGMSYLVIRSFNTTYELVENDYYNSELAYQKVIDGSNLAQTLQTQVVVDQSQRGIGIQLPAEMKNKAVKGSLWFYCDYDQFRDKKMDLLTDTNALQLIDKNKIAPGHYLVKITWECEGKNYYSEKPLIVN